MTMSSNSSFLFPAHGTAFDQLKSVLILPLATDCNLHADQPSSYLAGFFLLTLKVKKCPPIDGALISESGELQIYYMTASKMRLVCLLHTTTF